MTELSIAENIPSPKLVSAKSEQKIKVIPTDITHIHDGQQCHGQPIEVGPELAELLIKQGRAKFV